MGQCNLDHTLEDVMKKYQSQTEFLPLDLKESFAGFFEKTHSQATLNEVFHLLKKYDLSSEEEKLIRNEKLIAIL